MATGAAVRKVRVWDLPIRLVHWSLVILLPGLWWTHRSGDMELHSKLGYLVLALLVFRLFWGFAGSSTARFASFVKGPRAIRDYLSGAADKAILGHNPLGALSVLLLLGLLIVQVGLGLVAQDTDGLFSGPLSTYVSYETSDAARDWHELFFNLILGAVALHLAAILFYLLFKRDNLVGPMVTGKRAADDHVEGATAAPAWRAVVGMALALGIAWWVSLGAPLG